MKKFIYITALFCSILFNSCSVDSETSFLSQADSIGFTGSQQDIQEFLTLDVYNAIVALGLDVNSGGNPPILTGTYLLSPNELFATNIPGDSFEIGDVFFSELITFSNQNNEELTINFSSSNTDGSSPNFGLESRVTGNEDTGEFTVIIKITGSSEIFDENGNVIATVPFDRAGGYSGTVTSAGIQNFRNSFILTDKTDPDDYLIEIGEGRLIGDGDNISERQ